MRGRAVAEGVVHRGELGLHVVLAEPHQLKRLDHDLGIVVAHRAGAELHAVADEVVLVGGDGQRVELAALGGQHRLHAALGHREWVVAELQLAALLADLVHREIDDPAELVALLVHVTLAGGAEGLDGDAHGLGRELARAHDDQRIGLEPQLLGQLGLDGGDELADAAGELAVLIDLEPIALRAALHLAVAEQLVDLLARQLAVRDGHGLDRLTAQRLKFVLGEQLRHVGRSQVDAQIGLVAAVDRQRVVVRDAAERRLGCNIIGAELREDGGQHVLADGEHILLRRERHLHIQLIELAGGAVAARVLITEAGCDLEVAVEAARHQQLLELLRRLRQRVELARVLARGHEIVARALGGRGGQNRRRDLQEVVRHHRLTQRGDHLAAQDDVLLDGWIAQVKVAVLQALRFVGLAAAVDLKGQGIVAAAAEHLDLLGHDLDLAGGLLAVLARALAHGALDGDGALLVDPLDDLQVGLVLDDDLRRAVEIAQHDERQIAADLADVFHPADELDLLAHILDAKLVTVVCTGLHHKTITTPICNFKLK